MIDLDAGPATFVDRIAVALSPSSGTSTSLNACTLALTERQDLDRRIAIVPEIVLTCFPVPVRFPDVLARSSAGSKAWRRESRVPRKRDRDWSRDRRCFNPRHESREEASPSRSIGNEGMTSRRRNEDLGRVSSHSSNLPPARARYDHGPRGLSGDGLRAASYGLTRSLGSFA